MKPVQPPSDELPGVGEQERAHRQLLIQKTRELLIHFDATLRQLAMHDPTNRAVQSALDDVMRDIAALQNATSDLALVFAEGHTFVNGTWVRATKRAYESALSFSGKLKALEGRGLVIEVGTAPETLLKLMQLFRAQTMGKKVEPSAIEALPGLRLIPEPTAADRARAGRTAFRKRALEAFREGILTINKSALAQLDLFIRRRQRALVQWFVQLVEESPEDLLALTTLRDPRLPAASHTLTVCIFTVALGRQLGLHRKELLRLGICALNHNLGESLLPKHLFEKEGKFSGADRDALEQHPLLGMRYLLKHHGFDPPIVERALSSAEHHLHFDGQKGYPFHADWEIHLFSRLIAVADVFDALCSERPQRPAYPPDQGVKLLTRAAGTQLDPVLVRCLVRMVGRFPPGSVVELDTGELGLVIGPGKGADPLQRPRVLLITNSSGVQLRELLAVDLGERHTHRRAWVRTLVRTHNPSRLKRPISSYLFADRVEVSPALLDKDEFSQKKSNPLP